MLRYLKGSSVEKELPIPVYNAGMDAANTTVATLPRTKRRGRHPDKALLGAMVRNAPPGRHADRNGLYLFVQPPSGDLLDVDKRWRKFAVGTRMRRDRFETREELAESIRRASVYERLLPGAPDLIAQATLRPETAEEGYEPCCPRAYGALIFKYAFAYNLEPEPSTFSCPVKVIGSDPTVSFSFLTRRDLGGLTSLDYDCRQPANMGLSEADHPYTGGSPEPGSAEVNRRRPSGKLRNGS